MGLKVWLPLNGNTDNKGVTNFRLNVTQLTYDANGKIGKCLLNNNKISIPASVVPSIFNNTNMSMAFWYNNNGGANATHAICGFNGNSEGDSGSTRIWDFFQYSTKNDFHWSMGTMGSGVLSGVFPDNAWTHVCVTYDNGTLKIYMNGVLKHNSSGHSSAYTFNKNYYVGFGYNQKLNDFRIYDHTLSEREVKEISRGLILHYKLDHKGIGKNIISGPTVTDVRNYTYPTSSYSDKFAAKTSEIPSGDKYTLSFYAKSTVNGDVVRAHYYSPNTTTTCESSQGVVKTASDGNMDFTLSTDWEKYWVIYTQTSTTAQKNIIFPRMFSGSGSGTVSVKELKFEKGSVATPFSICSAATLTQEKAVYDYDSTKEHDCSGYGNHGTLSTTFDIDSDSPRYNFSYIFPNNKYINAGTGAKVKESVSVCWWGYMDDWTAYGRAISCTEGGGWSFEPASGKIQFPVGTGTTANTYKIVVSNTTLAQLGQKKWHHFVGTYDGLNIKIYIDGKLDNTLAAYTSKVPIFYHASNSVIIGAEATASGITTPYYNGKLSDIRIYATALDAEDIRELYEASALIDKKGNVYGYGLEEN